MGRVLMKMSIACMMALATYGVAAHASIITNPKDGLCESLVSIHRGYICREHVSLTRDGFLLGVQRIRTSRPSSSSAPKGTAFLMHGIFTGGDVWVLNSPSEALGFILADAGYDVWIGNTRTTKFSRGHVVLQRSDPAYWDWSVDEMARYDLPAMLSLVYGSSSKRVHYIGYSQEPDEQLYRLLTMYAGTVDWSIRMQWKGSQQAFAALSEGELLTYIDKVVMLAPVAYVDHGTAPLELGLFHLHIAEILQASHVSEFNIQTKIGTRIVDFICKQNSKCVEDWIFLFAGHTCCLNITKLRILEKFEMQSTSVKNLVHLAQQGHMSNFARFDYGTMENQKRYGKPEPPPYTMANIPPLKMLFITGFRDGLADIIDVMRLKTELTFSIQSHQNYIFGHLDIILSESANIQIYGEILRFFTHL